MDVYEFFEGLTERLKQPLNENDSSFDVFKRYARDTLHLDCGLRDCLLNIILDNDVCDDFSSKQHISDLIKICFSAIICDDRANLKRLDYKLSNDKIRIDFDVDDDVVERDFSQEIDEDF